MQRRYRHTQHGFTLIEMIIVIVITGIIAGMIAIFIKKPVEGYSDLTRRAELVDAAEMALQGMGRDIRRALPNSIRVTNNNVLEMINTVDGGRYRAAPPGGPSKILQFNKADTDFNLIGHLQNIQHSAATPFVTTTDRLVVYNLGTNGLDAYTGTNVITPAGTQITLGIDPTDSTEDHITLNTGYQFAQPSPNQRIFFVDTPITYLCDGTSGTLKRYSGYPLTANQSNVDTPAKLNAAGATASVVTNHVDCAKTTFIYQPGTPSRVDLATLKITLTYQGETVTLLHQVHVDNLP